MTSNHCNTYSSTRKVRRCGERRRACSIRRRCLFRRLRCRVQSLSVRSRCFARLKSIRSKRGRRRISNSRSSWVDCPSVASRWSAIRPRSAACCLRIAPTIGKTGCRRRILSAGLANGLLSAEGNQWKTQRRALAPLFSRKTVLAFSAAMVDSAHALVERLARQQDQVVDVAVEATRTTLDVLERTIFSDGFGRDAEEIRVAMKSYFDTIGRIDPLDLLGLPAVVPRPSRWRLRPMLRLFEDAIDTIISTRRRQIARNKPDVPRDILTFLLEARDPETGEALSEVEIRANVLTFIAAGQETTANCITWSLFLLSQSPEWRQRIQAEADREFGDGGGNVADRLVETRALVEETNRLYPPLAAMSRAALGPDELAGQRIRRGTMVVIAPYVLHRHRALWIEARLFRSEPLPQWCAREDRPLRVFAVRRRAAHLHWRHFRHPGSHDRLGGDYAELQSGARARPRGLAGAQGDVTAERRLTNDRQAPNSLTLALSGIDLRRRNKLSAYQTVIGPLAKELAYHQRDHAK